MKLAIALLSTGCAEDLRPDRPDGGLPGEGLPPGSFTTTTLPDGTFLTIVDASATHAWIYGDFETAAAIDETGPWDLRFQRFHISTNGGVSGSGGVEVAAIPNTSLDELVVPSEGFVSDAPDGDDENAEPDYAFEQGDGWYDYDPQTHVLTPKAMAWVVRTNGGSTIALAIQGYYDTAGTAGWFSFRWARR